MKPGLLDPKLLEPVTVSRVLLWDIMPCSPVKDPNLLVYGVMSQLI